MASIISAGTTSGTALNMAGDTSGVLQLATNGSTTAITIDTSQNTTFAGKVTSAGALTLASNGSTTALTIDTSQNVGIGTASPGYLLNVSANGGGSDSAQFVRITDTSTSNGVGPLHLTIGAANHFAASPSPVLCGTNGIAFGVGDGSDLATQRKMTIDSSGNVLINLTGQQSSGKFCINFDGATHNGQVLNDTGSASSIAYTYFLRSGTLKGYIGYTTGSNLVSYNTTSDYRLKENIVPLPNGLDTVMKLKPSQYSWKENGYTTTGFIAHELQEFVPDCVTGEKDAIDEEGNIKPQGIDTSFLVATLTAAIQEQQTIINDLKARITALEGAA